MCLACLVKSVQKRLINSSLDEREELVIGVSLRLVLLRLFSGNVFSFENLDKINLLNFNIDSLELDMFSILKIQNA